MKHNTPYGHLIARLEPMLCEWGFDMSRWVVVMDGRLRTCGGRCRVHFKNRTVTLMLNAELFARISDEERWNVLTHEAAHGVCFELGKWDDAHGEIWRGIHRRLGGDSTRCHDLDVRHNLVRRYVVLDRVKNMHYVVTLQKWKRLKQVIHQLPYELTGVAVCNRNDMTWKWERLCLPVYKDAAIFTKLRRIE